MSDQSLLSVVKRSDLLDILSALAMTDCDLRTLYIVAQSVGVEAHFVDRLPQCERVRVIDRQQLPGEAAQ